MAANRRDSDERSRWEDGHWLARGSEWKSNVDLEEVGNRWSIYKNWQNKIWINLFKCDALLLPKTNNGLFSLISSNVITCHHLRQIMNHSVLISSNVIPCHHTRQIMDYSVLISSNVIPCYHLRQIMDYSYFDFQEKEYATYQTITRACICIQARAHVLELQEHGSEKF